MKLDIYQIDAFADRIFTGNPAAVCPLDEWLPDERMQQIAMENNLSETAFFIKQEGGFGLRWFTPKDEVELCGHATLATAHVLFHHLKYDSNKISFSTKSGELSVTKEGQWYALNFPAKPFPREAPPLDLYHALGGEIADEVFKADDYLWVLDKQAKVQRMAPDFSLLEKVNTRGVIVTAPADGEADFVSRFFAPAVGVNEDPVTGSAHTMLIPYWAKRLGKKNLVAQQISARGGTLKCKLLENDRVEISGLAKTYMTGQIKMGDLAED